MKSKSREINLSGNASLCDERALTVLDGSRMAYDGIMGRTKYDKVASVSPFFFFVFFVFLNLDTSFFFQRQEKKNHSHGVKDPRITVLECMIIGWAGTHHGLLACTDITKGEEKETAHI